MQRVSPPRWCRHETLSRDEAAALAKVLRSEGKPVMQLRDSLNHVSVVRGYCQPGHFNAYVLAAKIEVRESVKATAIADLHRAGTEAAKVAARPARRRCEHYPLIRSFYAVATAAGLDTKADGPMRRAISHYMGVTVYSRSELDGSDWQLLTGAVELGHLTW